MYLYQIAPRNFPLSVEGPDGFFFKVHFCPMLFQLADRSQTVDCVAGKAAHAFCNDQIDLSGKRIANHGVEAVPLACAQTADPFIRIYSNELPIRMGADEIGVVIHLCLIAGELLVTVGAHTGLPGDTA